MIKNICFNILGYVVSVLIMWLFVYGWMFKRIGVCGIDSLLFTSIIIAIVFLFMKIFNMKWGIVFYEK